MFQKLWRVASIQGHYDPWHPELLQRNEAQIDAILEAYSKDNPKKLRFERQSSRRSRDQIEQLSVDWSTKLIGKGRQQFDNKIRFKVPDHFRAIREHAKPKAGRNMPRRKH